MLRMLGIFSMLSAGAVFIIEKPLQRLQNLFSSALCMTKRTPTLFFRALIYFIAAVPGVLSWFTVLGSLCLCSCATVSKIPEFDFYNSALLVGWIQRRHQEGHGTSSSRNNRNISRKLFK